jgi:hypothetical protein
MANVFAITKLCRPAHCTANEQSMDHPGQLIVICGLGGLGQACLRTLRQFDVPVRCLDLSPPMGMDGMGRAGEAEAWLVGDMRRPDALQQAGVGQARAVLLLSSDSGVNLEAALQVRLLKSSLKNPPTSAKMGQLPSPDARPPGAQRLPVLLRVD